MAATRRRSDDNTASAITCEGDALEGDTGLPAKFPTPPELTYVKSEQLGPTRVVNGYFEGSLEMAYEDYKSGFKSAGYKVLFDEIEENDSEVSYEDPASSTTGIVALKAECDDDDRISVASRTVRNRARRPRARAGLRRGASRRRGGRMRRLRRREHHDTTTTTSDPIAGR